MKVLLFCNNELSHSSVKAGHTYDGDSVSIYFPSSLRFSFRFHLLEVLFVGRRVPILYTLIVSL